MIFVNMGEFIALAHFDTAYDLCILRNVLEMHHISFIVLDQSGSNIMPIWMNTLGGIGLYVHPNDFLKANYLFSEYKYANHLRRV